MDKISYLKKIIDESVSEIATDFDNFSDFQNSMQNEQHCFVYSQMDKESLENLKKYGTSSWTDFARAMVYGRGIYGVLTYDEGRNTGRGGLMVKYVVKKGGFNNFLIFDGEMRSMLQANGGLTENPYKLSKKLKELLPPEKVAEIERRFRTSERNGLDNLDRELALSQGSSKSNSIQSTVLSILRSGEGYKKYHEHMDYNSEELLDISGVDGWAYYGPYGHTVVFRTTDLLFPYAICTRDGHQFPFNEDGFKELFKDEKSFDNANIAVDAFRRFRKDYPDTKFTEKTVCGFSLVQNGKKFNLVNARTGKLFSPVDFDACERFNIMTNTATFDIIDEEILRFTITSNNNAESVELHMQVLDKDKNVLQEGDVSYEDFCSIMEDFKSESLNESVNEVFTHKTRDEFYNAYKNGKYGVHLYRATNSQQTLESMKNGISNDFAGTGGDSSMYYGNGTYWVRNKQSILWEKYGRFVIDCVLKDGFRNFLIFDDDLRNKIYPGQTIYDQLTHLCSPEVIEEINQSMKNNSSFRRFSSLNNSLGEKGLSVFKNVKGSVAHNNKIGEFRRTAPFAKAFFEAIKGDPLAENKLGARLFDEKLLAKTRIRGYVFTGAADNNVVVVKNPNDLMPVGYSTDGGKTFKGFEHTEEDFNRINQEVNPYMQYRGEYDKTEMTEKQSCGFSRVSGSNGSNYIDIWMHKKLLPIDVDNATPFNKMDNSAYFELCGEEFKITVIDKDRYSLSYKDEGGFEPVGFEELCQFINMGKEHGMLNNKQMHSDCILNSSNC